MQDSLRVGILGLGMMGCSLAYSLRQCKNIDKIYGFDIEDEHNDNVLNLGLIDEITPLESMMKSIDILFLVIPSSSIIKILPSLENTNKNITIIDFASVKKTITENIPSSIKENFVPSHPMCGNEKAGPSGYEKSLYKNKTMIICNKEDIKEKHLNQAIDIFTLLDMKLIYMDSSIHDKHIGFISHLPHVVSFVLSNVVLEQEDPSSIVDLRGGGFESMSRLAKSNGVLWTDIFKANKNNLENTLDEYEKQFHIFRKYLKDDNWDGMKKWISKSNKLQDIL